MSEFHFHGPVLNQWISVNDQLPERKEDWDHSKQVLLWYAGNEKYVKDYGIGYYHYNPPFSKPGFIDFNNYGRTPTHWIPLPEPPKD